MDITLELANGRGSFILDSLCSLSAGLGKLEGSRTWDKSFHSVYLKIKKLVLRRESHTLANHYRTTSPL